MENLNIVSLNVSGLQNNNKRNRIFQYLKIKKYDVILLQETYSTPGDKNGKRNGKALPFSPPLAIINAE